MKLPKKWPEMVVKQSFIVLFHFRTVYKKQSFIHSCKQRIYDYCYDSASEALHMVSFEIIANSMTYCLSELKVTASFCFQTQSLKTGPKLDCICKNYLQDGKIIAIYASQDIYKRGLMQGIVIKFDFSWYPFDTQKIIAPVMTGKLS